MQLFSRLRHRSGGMNGHDGSQMTKLDVHEYFS
jgi:hypothetical protein